MKGGITSGVVYPHAVCELARTYRFKNVGGTSAGAMAAAATAAAERGRESGAFARLADLPAWLGSDTHLQDLFQPQPATRGLYAVLLAAIGRGPRAAVAAAVRHHPLAVAGGALPGAALIVLAALDGHGALAVVAIVAGVVLGLAGAVAALVARMLKAAGRAIPDNGYGLCSGWAPPDKAPTEPLTTWLHRLLLDYAGPLPADAPLTFGHLWAGPDRADPPADPDERHVQLQVMTTNLTNRRAHRLPWDASGWFFDPDEFRALFPEEVVAWMERHPPPDPDGDAERRDARLQRALLAPLLPLPAPEDLPVVVATRLSLSFPVLLSAVPLWRLDMSLRSNAVLHDWSRWAREQGPDWDPLDADRAQWPAAHQPATRPQAERCWFSDGGISSNFPVHFFDRFVPRWPTFAINLRPFHPDARESADQMENTWMATDNSGGIVEWWYRWPARPARWLADRRLGAFLSSVTQTMQNRADEAQMHVPGYRDRIVHVSLADDEGGMKLTMAPATIGALTERGRCAAQRLVEAFTRPAGDGVISWDNHRWVRLRSTLAVLEDMNRRTASGYRDPPVVPGDRTYDAILDRAADDPPRSYPLTAGQRDLAHTQVDAVLELVHEADGTGRSLAPGAPEPAPEGRILPRE